MYMLDRAKVAAAAVPMTDADCLTDFTVASDDAVASDAARLTEMKVLLSIWQQLPSRHVSPRHSAAAAAVLPLLLSLVNNHGSIRTSDIALLCRWLKT
jgi:hypothetical protein